MVLHLVLGVGTTVVRDLANSLSGFQVFIFINNNWKGLHSLEATRRIHWLVLVLLIMQMRRSNLSNHESRRMLGFVPSECSDHPSYCRTRCRAPCWSRSLISDQWSNNSTITWLSVFPLAHTSIGTLNW